MKNWVSPFNPAELRNKIEEYDLMASEPDFWNDAERSQKILQEAGALKNKLADYEHVIQSYEDACTLLEMATEEEDGSMAEELEQEIQDFKDSYEKYRLRALLCGEFDNKNAIVTLHAGAGGTEACDWTEMLYRMYTRWAEKQGYKLELLDYQEGDEAGIKSVTFQVNGENAFGYLKSEKGIHRLVRISPFDSSGRRHTSFAALEVMPEIDDSMEVDIRPEDIKGKKRNSEIVFPRQIAMYLCREIIGIPLKSIGTIMGKKDHTTVIHACNTIVADMEKSESTRNTVEIIKKKITPN